MPRLSIIIPSLGSTQRMEATLASVLQRRPEDCEILVVLDADYSDPYKLEGEVRWIRAPQSAGLVERLNQGIQASQSSLVHVLAAGIEAVDGWVDSALIHFFDPRVAAVSPIVLDAQHPQSVLAAGMEFSPQNERLVLGDDALLSERAPPRDQLGPLLPAAFFRRTALELLGGLPLAVGDSLADLDFALMLHQAGYRAVLEPRSRVTAVASDLALEGPTGFRAGLAAERLYWRNSGMVSWSAALIGHPLLAMREFLPSALHYRGWTRLFGRAFGACQVGSYKAHHAWLNDVRLAAQALLRAQRPSHTRIDPAHPAPFATDTATIRPASRIRAAG